MAGLDLGTASYYTHHLHHPQLHLQRQSEESEDDPNNENEASDPGHGAITGRRTRGRPPGSKNKPKPLPSTNQEGVNTLRAHILQVENGCDVFDSIASFARRRQHGICILSGNGIVKNVSLRRPAVVGEILTLRGRFEIVSITGSFLPPPAPPGATSLTIFLDGGNGQIVGGNVVGELIAEGSVFVSAASFTNVAYERLPAAEEIDRVEMQAPVSQASDVGGCDGNDPFSDPCSGFPFIGLPVSMQNVQLPVDVVWPENSTGSPF